MKYYLDIVLLPDSESNAGFLCQKVFQQMHIALADNGYDSKRTVKRKDGGESPLKNSKIAVSFPCYGDEGFPIGNTLRLLAPEKELLEILNIGKWLNRLTDYVQVSSIKSVPDEVTYVQFARKHFKGNFQSNLRRKAKHISQKFEVDYQTILSELTLKHKSEDSDLPFIWLESQSSDVVGQKPRFKLFVDKVESEQAKDGDFDTYGLSKTATVPWF